MLVEKLDRIHLGERGDHGSWWPGKDKVLADWAEKKRTERLREELRRARKTAFDETSGKRKQDSSHVQRSKRRVSESHDDKVVFAIEDEARPEKQEEDQSAKNFWDDLDENEGPEADLLTGLDFGYSGASQDDMLTSHILNSEAGQGSDMENDDQHAGADLEKLFGLGDESDPPKGHKDGPLVASEVSADPTVDPEYEYSPISPACSGDDEAKPSSPVCEAKSPSGASPVGQDLDDALAALAEYASRSPHSQAGSVSGEGGGSHDGSSSSSSSSSSDSPASSDGAGREDRFLEQFGPFVLRKIFEKYEHVGVRILCGKHRNSSASLPDGKESTNPCMRGIYVGVSKSRLSEDVAKLRCKRWACYGFRICPTDPQGRKKHHSKAPRAFSRHLTPELKARIPVDLFPAGALDYI